MHRGKPGGCLEMTHIKVVASFCAASALALLLFLSLDFASGPCRQQNGLYSFRQSLYLSSIRDSLKATPEERNASGITCSNTPAVQTMGEVCYSEWEKPSVIKEREWEKFWDENTPEVQRTFTPVGVSAFLFINFGAYRLSPNNFSIVGLSPRALNSYGNPGYDCFWIPKSGDPIAIEGNATAYFPGMRFANQYAGTVIHCQFDRDVGTDHGTGGSLKIVAKMGSLDMTGLPGAEFMALTEKPGEYDGSLFKEPFKYDFMYCGSPLYGPISPQRVREWIAWHARIFGPRSHFILYDGGGLHDDVRKILAPWVKLGRVSIMNYRQEARYDAHYHSQAVVLNDCLMQAKRLAEWAFFFDIDEYLYVASNLSLAGVMKEIKEEKGRNAQQVTFNQRPINPNHCVKRPQNDSDERFNRLWGIEKLVYQRTQVTERGGWMDHKYAVQTKYMLVAGTHDHEVSFMPEGMTDWKHAFFYEWKSRVTYHHFHNTITIREELCKKFVDPWVKETKFNNVTHIYDDSMAELADAVRKFELETVGSQPFIL
ncbi:unnamed protein product [Calypogeia fissa]